ncbi:AraC family transcriptional regulator [Flavitalea sp. BT771]|uniref:helix-turn-helix domain-containing protein n=1 Tax=Flavitalea sp. BT771 TaxID=3063329 RepID=UPI0026E311E6|nr:AraC family transcriptional regulator [Flavitalea sp. BT771]MDO6432839.1 AraC family transcriptional regulator [Flavitalea sp. BT771]MDV6221885.1 AraC family transcriptional regulator [Flavitalea sp. BT771]
MFIHNLFEPYEIECQELEECPMGDHKNTFFELVYIVKGAGTHFIDGNTFEYDEGTLFLLLPQHVHSFEVKELTSFLFIRFNDIYLKAQKGKHQHGNLGDWIQKLEYILESNYHLPGCILQNRNDKPLVAALIDGIIREYADRQEFHTEVVQHLVNTIITIVARNIWLIGSANTIAEQGHSSKIIRYIHEQIHLPENLKSAVIAGHFNISPRYIHEYFRKHTGESLQQYINGYRLKLVETRLRYSNMRMSEIVNELGFTDESHLNRVFKKHKGLSPSAYRKKMGV